MTAKPNAGKGEERALKLVRQVLSDPRSKEMRRSLTVDKVEADEEARTVELSFASESPVEVYFGEETLEISERAVDLVRLMNGGAGLVNHDWNDQVAVVERAWIDESTRKARAVLRFSRSARAQEIFDDIKDGIRRLVSVGYTIVDMVNTGTREGLETFRVTRWQPYEVSIVSIPADVSVGVGRSKKPNQTESQRIQETNTMSIIDIAPAAPAVQVTVDEGQMRAQIQKEEGARIREITAISQRYEVPAERREKAINEGESLDNFRSFVLRDHLKAKPITASPGIGLKPDQARRYRLTRAMALMLAGKPVDGLEGEVSQEMARKLNRQPEGFFISHEVATSEDMEMVRALNGIGRNLRGIRSLNASTATEGGYTVGASVLGGSLIELLRARTMLAQLGVGTLSGLQGNVAIPSVANGAVAQWLAEGEAVTASKQGFGQVGLTPKRLVGQTAYTKQLLAQSSIDIEAFVRDDLMRVLALAKDLAGITGAGGKEPLGIVNTPGLGTAVTFGGAPVWQDVVDFETNIATANADIGTMAFLTTPSVRGKWKTTQKATNYPVYLTEGNEANGYPIYVTTQVPDNRVIFGVFSEALFADWEGIDIVVDPYTQAGSGLHVVTTTLHSDFAVRHGKSFVVSADAGNQ